ncbi:predicted protein [Naegleria gruberi]|uniref:Predicted protein n=1 Tax=Naegleria gruberi TaxID=5762 RepID=D2VB17_NAEGR|nr:uncharacterized protein NAEGRDRAFT_32493 [Naegleria gruberi]EFC46044.1 predicted protein [Naegleria gruberi]|eukprot:XP_002678788.1 predicted protein [Naegleria gruberi strain NEG-M]
MNELHSQLKQLEKSEEILSENPHRFTLFPIQYPKLWEIYKKRLASSIWSVEQFDQIIRNDISKLSEICNSDHSFIKIILAFLVANCKQKTNLWGAFKDIQILEAKHFHGFRLAMKNIHYEMYCNLFEILTEETERSELIEKMINSTMKKSQYTKKWLNSDNLFSERLIGLVCIEQIFLSASFFSIFWLKKRGLMSALTISNDLIFRDEEFHSNFLYSLYSNLKHSKLPQTLVHSLVKEAVDIEKEFITSLPTELIELDRNSMYQYVEVVSDNILISFGYEKLFHTENQCSWIQDMLMNKSGFFWKIGLESYSSIPHFPTINNELKLDEDF